MKSTVRPRNSRTAKAYAARLAVTNCAIITEPATMKLLSI